METGDIIKRLRTREGFTQEQLGEKLGLQKSAIAKYESGRVENLKRPTIAKLAKIFGVSPLLFVGEIDDETALRMMDSEILPVPDLAGLKKIPVLGSSACGSPIEAVREWDYIQVEKATRADFALIAEGKSMTGCGIMDGSMVLFQETPQVDNGQIAAVSVDNATTIKRFYQYPDMVILRACNPDFDDQEYSGDELATIHVFGRAVACLTGF